MTFTPIDAASWPQMQTFYYFSQIAPTGWSLTVELDVTALRQTLKGRGLKFYPAYLWLVTKNLNADPAFRLAKQGEQISGVLQKGTVKFQNGGKFRVQNRHVFYVNRNTVTFHGMSS